LVAGLNLLNSFNDYQARTGFLKIALKN